MLAALIALKINYGPDKVVLKLFIIDLDTEAHVQAASSLCFYVTFYCFASILNNPVCSCLLTETRAS